VIQDVAPGLWIWRVEHPDHGGDPDEWEPTVTCTCVESGGEIALLDPLWDEESVQRLDARPPTYVAILKPDHVRDVARFTRRYGVPAYGPALFWRDDIPEVELEPIARGSELPGGLRCLWDGRGRGETPLYLPEQQALVFADGMTAPRGELLIWDSPEHERWALAAFEAMLELPFEHVIVSHGEPLHDRAAFERALTLPTWATTRPGGG
jgi:hypothetical protein